MTFFSNIRRFFTVYKTNEDGVSAVESALIFPILISMLVGTFDVGYGILASQKTIRASQVAADLIARNKSVSEGQITEAMSAAEAAMMPFAGTSLGFDIVSVEFDEDNAPIELWRRTQNMPPNMNALLSLSGLGQEGEGVVIVTVQYMYEPTFGGIVVDEIPMQEVSFVRGRLSSTIPLAAGS